MVRYLKIVDEARKRGEVPEGSYRWVEVFDLSGNPTFVDLLSRVRRRVLDGAANQDLPFERLVEKLNPARTTASNPLFQVMVSFQSFVRNEQAARGWAGGDIRRSAAAHPRSRFDLAVNFMEHRGRAGAARGIRCTLQFDLGLFQPSTIEILGSRLRALLERNVAVIRDALL